jgi:hypothetical protein
MREPTDCGLHHKMKSLSHEVNSAGCHVTRQILVERAELERLTTALKTAEAHGNSRRLVKKTLALRGISAKRGLPALQFFEWQVTEYAYRQTRPREEEAFCFAARV